eukprot:443680-Pelagomonas_calceolata.AAC.3
MLKEQDGQTETAWVLIARTPQLGRAGIVLRPFQVRLSMRSRQCRHEEGSPGMEQAVQAWSRQRRHGAGSAGMKQADGLSMGSRQCKLETQPCFFLKSEALRPLQAGLSMLIKEKNYAGSENTLHIN